MRNVVENMVSFLILGVVLIALFISMSIGDYMYSNLSQKLSGVVNKTNQTTFYNEVKSDIEEGKDTLYNAIKFLVYFIIALSIYSSFAQVNSLQTFIMSFILSIFLGAFTLYLLTTIYNTFVLNLAHYEIFDVDKLFNDFFLNLHIILMANIIAFLLGFIFTKKAMVINNV